jgi:arylsulfatase A-like enzyme
MKRILPISLFLLAAVSLLAGRPNVLFIAVDDLKPLLGAYGYDAVQSPNIDKLASQGTVFMNAACQFPVCGPSRASIMTGLRPESTGVLNLKTRMRDVHPDILTIPEHFKNNGYKTAGVGKIYDPRCVDSRKLGDAQSWSLPYKEGPHSDVPMMPKSKQATARHDLPDEAFPDGRILKGGLERLRELASGDEPFFLGVGFKKPHLPFVAPERFWELYAPESIELAAFQEKTRNNSGYGYWNSNEARGYGGVPSEGPIPEDVQRNLIHGYMACVSWVDYLVGELLAELEALSLSENTIVVLWGDHGFHLGDHGLWGKHTPFEEAIRAPLIIVDPSISASHRTNAPAEFTDVFPTLCELAGLPVPDQLQGVSLVPSLRDPDETPRAVSTAIYKSRGAFGYSVRNKRFRYIEWVNTKTAKVVGKDLFDFKEDPEGRINLAGHPDYVEVQSDMAEALHSDSTGWTLLERSLKKR